MPELEDDDLDGLDEGILGSGSSNEPDDADDGEGEGKPEPKRGKDEVRLSKKEYDQLLKQREELEESARYWAELARGKANGKGKPADDDEPEPEPDDDKDDFDGEEPEKVVDEFGVKGIKALVERGVLTKKAARDLIRKEAERVARTVVKTETQKLESDAKLLRAFPDLQNEDSELYKRTAKVFREMVADDPALRKSGAALMIAARTAKAELAAERKNSDGRAARIAAQMGDTDPYGDDDDNALGPAARQIIAGMKVSEKDFLRFRGGKR